jgi:isopenicillin N synthase-like dioxygenase
MRTSLLSHATQCFTILWQEPGIQALQVLNPETRKWINAPPKPGTLVVNIGDQFMRWTSSLCSWLRIHAFYSWTDDTFKSNTHRAINRTGIERYSIPLFFGTDYDVLLEVRTSFLLGIENNDDFDLKPIPGCVSEDRPAKYKAITAGEFIRSRLQATYS